MRKASILRSALLLAVFAVMMGDSCSRVFRDRGLTNKVPVSEETLAEGRAHFADHRASCHGNEGSGNTEMGRGRYPWAPGMRLPATRNLSDGELFYSSKTACA
jgi:mono/diheme cytochrome c family protein